MPKAQVRRIRTQVTVHDGETVLVGDIAQRIDDSSKPAARNPDAGLLGNIRLVGRLFNSSTDERRSLQLVIIVTPTLVGSGGRSSGHSPPASTGGGAETSQDEDIGGG